MAEFAIKIGDKACLGGGHFGVTLTLPDGSKSSRTVHEAELLEPVDAVEERRLQEELTWLQFRRKAQEQADTKHATLKKKLNAKTLEAVQ